jgi:hypothetical protein
MVTEAPELFMWISLSVRRPNLLLESVPSYCRWTTTTAVVHSQSQMQSSIQRVFPQKSYTSTSRDISLLCHGPNFCAKLVTCRAVYLPSHFAGLNSSPRLQLLDLDAYPFIIATGEPSPSNLDPISQSSCILCI